MPIKECDLHVDVDANAVSREIRQWIQFARRYIAAFWDRNPHLRKTEFIECDFEYAAEAIMACRSNNLIAGNRFVEWGCGFGVVAGIASRLGMESVGIEAEGFLCEAARRLQLEDPGRRCLAREGALVASGAEVWHGNFLPAGASSLILPEEPRVAASHTVASAYEDRGVDITQFDCFFVYAWPGEEHFLKSVFERSAAPNALLILYRGPYHVEFYQKTS